jgi:Nuclease-related domain
LRALLELTASLDDLAPGLREVGGARFCCGSMEGEAHALASIPISAHGLADGKEMGRAGAAVRERATDGRRAWVRAGARPLLMVATSYLFAGSIIYLIQARSVRPYVAGGLLVGAAWLVCWVLSMDGFDRVRLGARAEGWTSSTLRKSRRAGWRVIDSIPFEGFDVDHVFVGPGGVFAVETKFTSIPWRQSQDGLVAPFGDPVGQATFGARKVRLFLSTKGCCVPVTPVVLAWGRGANDLQRSMVDGVVVLPGGELRAWMSEMAGAASLTDHDVLAIERALLGFIDERRRFERDRRP